MDGLWLMCRRMMPGLLTLAVCWLQPAGLHAQSSGTPVFLPGTCPFKLGYGLKEGSDVRCGTVQVPENRAHPDGHTVNLAVAVFSSVRPDRRPDPVFYLNGGPGDWTLGEFGNVVNMDSRNFVLGNRDLVLIDQRGTGDSTPRLTCPQVPFPSDRHSSSAQVMKQETAQLVSLATTCRDRLVAQGVDLAAFNTEENAHDIADVRRALGYDAINLYGVSYGSRLALSVMRNDPAGLRSVILDSVYAPGINLVTDPLRSAARDLNLIFTRCAAGAACRAAYPHLRSSLIALVRRLDAHPHLLHLVMPNGTTHIALRLTGEIFLSILFDTMYVSSLLPHVPQMIHDAYTGDFHLTTEVGGEIVAARKHGSDGMYYSVECGEDGAYASAGDIVTAAQALPAPLRRDFAADSYRFLAVCSAWGVPPVPPAQRTPVHSDIPTLVFEGEFDPITPPAYGAGVAAGLSHAYLEVFPGLGHGTLFESCPHSIASAFLDDPTHVPDVSCISGMSEPFR